MKFTELQLHPKLQQNLDRIQFVDCTPIQDAAIPPALQGRDLAGLAQTGTGKTGAFLIPLIERVLRGKDATENSAAGVEPSVAPPAEPPAEGAAEKPARLFADWRYRQFILILVPTRELAEQVHINAQGLLEGTGLSAVSVYGGTGYEKQTAAIKKGVEFVIATPGRLIDLFKEHIVDLRQVRAIVFDEADRMFDMGFKDDMKFILRRIPRERQFLVFSATLNFDVLNVAYEFGADPVEININRDQPKAENVTDELFHVGHDDKPKFLLSLLTKHNPKQVIIFSNFKHNVERIARFLTANGVPAVGISSLLTQAQRNRVMAQFKAENDRNILVATDLAARGLDILGVDMVINYELPDDPENYVHRIGRTGRAGQKGVAFSMASDRDVDSMARIEEYLGHKVPIGWLDDNDLVKEMKPFPKDDGERFGRPAHKKSFRDGPPRREGGGGPKSGGRDRFERRPPRRGGPDRHHDQPRQEGQPPRHEGQGRHEGQQARHDKHGHDKHDSSGRYEKRAHDRSDRPQKGNGPAKSGHQHHKGNKPHHHKGPRPPRRGHAPHNNERRATGATSASSKRVPVAAKSSATLGTKVSGFLKKLFSR